MTPRQDLFWLPSMEVHPLTTLLPIKCLDISVFEAMYGALPERADDCGENGFWWRICRMRFASRGILLEAEAAEAGLLRVRFPLRSWGKLLMRMS